MTHTFLKKESMKMIKIKYRVKGCLHGTAHIGMNKLQPDLSHTFSLPSPTHQQI